MLTSDLRLQSLIRIIQTLEADTNKYAYEAEVRVQEISERLGSVTTSLTTTISIGVDKLEFNNKITIIKNSQ